MLSGTGATLAGRDVGGLGTNYLDFVWPEQGHAYTGSRHVRIPEKSALGGFCWYPSSLPQVIR